MAEIDWPDNEEEDTDSGSGPSIVVLENEPGNDFDSWVLPTPESSERGLFELVEPQREDRQESDREASRAALAAVERPLSVERKVEGWLDSVVVVPQATMARWENPTEETARPETSGANQAGADESAGSNHEGAGRIRLSGESGEPGLAGSNEYDRRAEPETRLDRYHAPTSSRQRYSRIIPFHRLPGPVPLSGSMVTKKDHVVREMLRIVHCAGVRLSSVQLSMIYRRTRALQTEIFDNIEALHGGRNGRGVPGIRYNLKAFNGPLLDYSNELRSDIHEMPVGVRRMKVRIMEDLLERLLWMDDESLY